MKLNAMQAQLLIQILLESLNASQKKFSHTLYMRKHLYETIMRQQNQAVKDLQDVDNDVD